MALSNRRGIVVGSLIGVPVTFALDVLGAMGATWGSSEVFKLRNVENQMAWRLTAAAVCVIALGRYMAAYFVKKPDPDRFRPQTLQYILYAFAFPHIAFQSLPLRRKTVLTGLVLGIAVTLVLEVFGAAGAIWGSSEIFGLRHDANKEAWRAVAISFFVTALARFVAKYVVYQPQSPWEPEQNGQNNLLALVFPDKAIRKVTFLEKRFLAAFSVGLTVTFALEVLGAAGAIWGSSDVFALHSKRGSIFWRAAAITICAASIVRYGAKYRCSGESMFYESDNSMKSHFWRAVESPEAAIKYETLSQRLESVYPLIASQ